MNISKQVSDRLETLAAKGPNEVEAVILDSTQEEGYIVGVALEEQNLGITLTLQGYDRYSVALRQLEVSHNVDSNLTGQTSEAAKEKLQHWADQIIQRLNYLEEPLTLLELDAGARIAQLRSVSPHRDEETLTYWEAMIQAEPHPRVKLSRYYWSPVGPTREVAVYPAAFGILGRIAQDLAESLTE
jgi:hypothetical protein